MPTMPRPVSPSSRPSIFSGPSRRFTLAQADRALPLVQRIAADVVRTHDHAMHLQGALDQQRAGATHKELDAVMDRLQDYVAELTEIGCELKDYRTGLVDFVGRHQGRDVLLCWRLGEESVAFWHEMNAGFAGRRPVSQLDERT